MKATEAIKQMAAVLGMQPDASVSSVLDGVLALSGRAQKLADEIRRDRLEPAKSFKERLVAGEVTVTSMLHEMEEYLLLLHRDGWTGNAMRGEAHRGFIYERHAATLFKEIAKLRAQAALAGV